jgi:hypothetical protein
VIRGIRELADGRLVLVDEAGAVSILQAAADGVFSVFETLTLLSDALPADPTDLEAFQTDDGLRVFVTSAGDDSVFVYGEESSGGGGPGSKPPPEEGSGGNESGGVRLPQQNPTAPQTLTVASPNSPLNLLVIVGADVAGGSPSPAAAVGHGAGAAAADEGVTSAVPGRKTGADPGGGDVDEFDAMEEEWWENGTIATANADRPAEDRVLPVEAPLLVAAAPTTSADDIAWTGPPEVVLEPLVVSPTAPAEPVIAPTPTSESGSVAKEAPGATACQPDRLPNGPTGMPVEAEREVRQTDWSDADRTQEALLVVGAFGGVAWWLRPSTEPTRKKAARPGLWGNQ